MKTSPYKTAEEQYQLGKRYLAGEVVPPDELQLEYIKRRTDYGAKISQSFNKAAFSCFQQAAELGHTKAQEELARCYLLGRGCRKNIKKFKTWCLRAAKAGDADAQTSLALYYEDIKTGEANAKKWYQSAIDQGHDWACYFFAQWFLDEEKYTAEAVELIRLAAERKLWLAHSILGKCYAVGEGVERNLVEAYAWLSLAMLSDYNEEKPEFDKIILEMNQEELKQAKLLTSRYTELFFEKLDECQ